MGSFSALNQSSNKEGDALLMHAKLVENYRLPFFYFRQRSSSHVNVG